MTTFRRAEAELLCSRIRAALVAVLAAVPLFASSWGLGPPGLAAQEPYDLLILGGRLLDGTGNPWYRADVAVDDDTIVAVGNLSGAQAAKVLDATGLYVAPGFIDTHSHAARGGLTTAELSAGEPLLAQGITTVIVNPDGGGPLDLSRQRSDLQEHGLGVNVAQLVPHNTIRRHVMGMRDREPSAAELEEMRQLVRRGMESGAFGLSTGLFSAPGSYSQTPEVIALARVAAEYGAVYASHIRDEADYSVGLLAAVDEVIRVAREAALPGVVTHIKALGPRVWGFSGALVSRIERARDEGVEVFADQYPYTASATSLTAALVPRWAEVGGRDSLVARIEDPSLRERLRTDMAENLDRRGGASRIAFRRYAPDPSIEGTTLADVARKRDRDPLTTALALISEGDPGIVSFNQHPEDVGRLMERPWVMTCSDGSLVRRGDGVPHPRSYGAFPHKLRRYVLEEGLVGLGFAIRSMTGLSATVFRIPDRGRVAEGFNADLVVFDLGEVGSPATYTDPHQLAEGMVHVLVGGILAVEDGEFTGAKNGTVLTMQTDEE